MAERRIVSVLFVALTLAGLRPALAFDGARAKALVDTLASDRYQGRKSGAPGGRMTEDFVAARFAEWGLTPGGEDGTWFQTLPLLVTTEHGAEMTLLDDPQGPVPVVYGVDFDLVTNSGSGDVTADVVLVGHGLCDPGREWDDYGDVDLRGKIAFILRGTPNNGYDWEEAGSRDSTLTEAIRRGAVAVLFLQGGRPVNGAAIHQAVYHPKVPMAMVGPRLLDRLLVNSGYSPKTYEDALKEHPLPLDTGKRLRFRAEVSAGVEGTARNVIGIVRGSDPARAKELIVIGGHMDHLGPNGNGVVYNGADDNGSGASVVMELARSFAAGPRPARTLVFITFAGEEQGLLGSKAFAAHPTVDLDRAVAMLNFDMEGNGNGKVGMGGGEYFPGIWKGFRASLSPAAAESLVAARAWGGDSSDHSSFRNRGIPAFTVWSEGDHPFYHSVDDDAAWITPEVLGSVGRRSEAWIRTLADWSHPLAMEHRDGRTLLYGADQVDLDGVTDESAPRWIRGRARWYGPRQFPQPAFIAALGSYEKRAADEDGFALAPSLGGVRGASRSGACASVLGVGTGGRSRIAPPDLELLDDLKIGLVRWTGPAPGAADDDYVRKLGGDGRVLVIPADSLWATALPPGVKAAVRFRPGHGGAVTHPEAWPRKTTVFVADLDGAVEPDSLASVIDRLGPDRVHLDLVPWAARSPEPEIWAFIEALQAAGGYSPARMRALLGGNLARL
jgi:hypothetical protein